MKGVLLAAGYGTRLIPLTKAVNKLLLPVGRVPMIYHALYKLKIAGIKDILIVLSKEQAGQVVKLLGSGEEFELALTYRIQESPGGIAQALSLAQGFIGAEKFLVILPDNLFEDDIAEYAEKYKQQKQGARVLITEVIDPHRYGIAELCGDQIVGIEEKPQYPKSNWCVTGIYMYDQHVFSIIKNLRPSARGELEITDVNNEYIKRGQLMYDKLKGWWIDAGTFDALKMADQLAWDTNIKLGPSDD